MQRVLLIVLFSSSFSVYCADTVLKLYRPFGETVEQVVPTVISQIPGQCLTPSEIITREDAWRCQAQGRTLDPCFVKSIKDQTEVICPQSPWVGDSVKIKLETPLTKEANKSLDMYSTYPWAVELQNGDKCQGIATQERYDGMPIRYRCTNQNILVGHLQRCRTEWSMLEKTPSGIQTAVVTKAWF